MILILMNLKKLLMMSFQISEMHGILLNIKKIILPSFAGKISQLNRERTPKLQNYLVLKIDELYKQAEE